MTVRNSPIRDIKVINTSITLILESPHSDEVSQRIPLVGSSGLRVSQGMLANKTRPAGLQAADGEVELSVINTFEYALQLADKMKSINLSIKSAFNKNSSLHKSSLKKVYSKCKLVESELRNSYINRLSSSLLQAREPVKLVVCGTTAQAFFEYALNLDPIRFGSRVTVNIFDKNIRVLYVQHPSAIAQGSFWNMGSKDNEKLIEFIHS